MQTIQDAKILVVDDNRELRNLIKEELTGAGYRAVRMADSAAAARQAISGELPELVFWTSTCRTATGSACSGRFGAEATSPFCFCPPETRTATGCSVWGWGRMII